MTKKAFVVILILSIVVTYGIAFLDFLLKISKGSVGLPFGFSRFNFFGAETNYLTFLLDVSFWFIIIWLLWKLLLKLINK